MVFFYSSKLSLLVSALEHRIPELFFSDENNPAEGISAVKALAVAAAEGQRIYQITSDNISTVLPQLTVSDDIKSEISAAVAPGQEATVSQGNITHAGWTGAGYIITDPNPGSGAYRISGGGNGGWVGLLNMFNSVMLFFIAGALGAASPIAIFFLGILAIQYFHLGLAQFTNQSGFFWNGVGVSIGFMIFGFSLGLSGVASESISFWGGVVGTAILSNLFTAFGVPRVLGTDN